MTNRCENDILVVYLSTALCGNCRASVTGMAPLLQNVLFKENKMSDFKTNAEKVDRSITLPLPSVMETETLADMVTLVGEDFCLNKVKGQMKIMLRSIARGKLEAINLPEDEKRSLTELHKLISTGEFKPNFVNSDKDISKAWDVKWVPELRVQKSAEEKALDTLQGLTPEEMQLVMEKFAAQQKEAKKAVK